MEFGGQFPDAINNFIIDIIDPSLDGHCGFRVIVVLLGITGTDGWKQGHKKFLPKLLHINNFMNKYHCTR